MLRAMWWLLTIAWARSPWLIVGTIAFTVFRSLTAAGIALVARGLINAAIHATGPGNHDLSGLLPWLAAGLGLGAVEALTPFILNLSRQRLADELSVEITSRVLTHVTELDVATLEEPQHRETVDRAQHDAEVMLARLVFEVELGASGVLQVALLGAVLIHLEPLVAVIVVPLALPYLYFQWVRAVRDHRREVVRQRQRRWTRYVASLLTGHRLLTEVRVLGIAPHLLEEFRRLMTRIHAEKRVILRRTFAHGSIFAVLTTLGLYAAFVLVVARVVQGTLTVGDVAVFAAASPRLRGALDRTLLSLRQVADEGLMIERVLAFLRVEPRLVSGSRTPPSPTRGEITLEDVWFTYPTATRPTLAGISLTLRPGEVVGLVGPNGAGKTTLVKLLVRLYDPDRGRILLDGQDLREWPLSELRRRIMLVSQESIRFEASAADNIGYGDWPRAASDPEGIRAAAADAGADAMIRALPAGYDTVLGRTFGDADLSGGQWQKIALARAFVRHAPILILDEPTAHLDAASLDELQVRLRELACGRTALLISHRPETLALADRILTMEHGRIVEHASPTHT
jgi:ATP-binding cassette subfamily B protein